MVVHNQRLPPYSINWYVCISFILCWWSIIDCPIKGGVGVYGMSYGHCQSSTYNSNNNNNNDNNDLVELVHANKPLSSLAPNQFHLICPGRKSSSVSSSVSTDDGISSIINNSDLSFPICGDGSTFSFLVSKPTQDSSTNASPKILIQFQGGGACWDADTCNESKERLSFPYRTISPFVGISCTEANAGLSRNNNGDNDNDYPINVLCAQQLGDVDFTTYHTIVVPYCTQDVFLGDAYTVYSNNNDNNNNNNNNNRRNAEEDNNYNNNNNNNGGDGGGVYHHGGHNLMAVLRYVYKNFHNPSHIALTGCSAGGTALPLAYDLLNKHYNHILGKSILPTVPSVNINVLSDSPVYLTPQYFLDNAFGHWNPSTILKKKTRFHFDKWQYNTEYPTVLWDHILKRGPNNDQWGLVIHNQDPIEELFYQAMSTGNYDYQQRQRRKLDNNENNNENNEQDDNDQEEEEEEEVNWFDEFSASLATIQSKHKNVDSFVINGDNHCSFGLYYALQQEGFEAWASNIFKEQRLLGHASYSIPLFVLSFMMGSFLSFYILYTHRHRHRQTTSSSSSSDTNHNNTNDNNKNVMLLGGGGEGKNGNEKRILNRWSNNLSRNVETFRDWPITAGYLVTISVYFISMLQVGGGFTHPLNNPSLGPDAVTLSTFGINNPTLVVFHYQFVRLIVSSFLCSGVLTYALVVFCLLQYTRPIEQVMNHSTHFAILSSILILGPNLAYATVSKGGASCSSIPLVLSFHAFSICSKLRENPPSTTTTTPKQPPTTTNHNNHNHNNSNIPTPINNSNDSSTSSHIIKDNDTTDNNDLNAAVISIGTEPTTTTTTTTTTTIITETTLTTNNNDKKTENVVPTTFPRPWCSTIVIFLITSFLFPFNSWFMILSALCIGALTGTFVFPSYEEFQKDKQIQKEKEKESHNHPNVEAGYDDTTTTTTTNNNNIMMVSSISSSKVVNESISKKGLGITTIIGSIFFIILMSNKSRNIQMYQYPYLTGCNVVYSNQVNEFVQNYQNNNNNNNGRYLKDNEDENDDSSSMCAQFCVPHLVHLPFMISVEKYMPNANLRNGLCHKNGYEEHVADKTFSRFGYNLDVSLYQDVDQN